MRIEDVVNIADGELVNAGYISDILFFEEELEKVRRETLFVSNDIEKIREAIKKGAYAILHSKKLRIIDEEIAWIRVESLEDSFLKLLKYKLLSNKLFVTDKITLEIIKSINKDKKVIVLDKIDFNFLNGDNLIYVTSSDKIAQIAINKIKIEKELKIEIIQHSTFLLDFIFKNHKYSLIFPFLYCNNLEKALSFFENLELNYLLKELKLSRLVPQFINSRYEKVEFGKSQIVVVEGIKKDNYFIDELNYLFQNLKYANVKFFDNSNIDSFYNEKFDFAILIDCKIELKEKKRNNVTLF